ncbi:hypothetical protein [Calothrix sp. NIES-2098]|uniref:hypothetical protein n=1 Tax=Calothrix sp. NIES-2098 TaxID=1954171 RepID=UPI000B6022C1|nr:hypothetical protein NIES2098_40200 [Calothrix sp. NIES-2098]
MLSFTSVQTPLATSRETLSAVAHGGDHASSYNGGNLRNGLAPLRTRHCITTAVAPQPTHLSLNY